MEEEGSDAPVKLTRYQRAMLRRLRKKAGRGEGEPLQEEDWEAVWRMHADPSVGSFHRVLARMPSSPRCRVCGAPFGGAGGRLLRPLGYRPSRKSPVVCSVCVELSPPGGATMPTGILFGDLRGFTARSEGSAPRAVSDDLRRFYAACERVLFPEAVIDKLIGDEVMALYLPFFEPGKHAATVELMLEHARGMMAAVGYGGDGEPWAALGIGLDFGEAYVGNIGDRALYDFTAVGDVVNTASRLQGAAGPGEIVISSRVAAHLADPPGEPVELQLKGKQVPEPAFRLRVG